MQVQSQTDAHQLHSAFKGKSDCEPENLISVLANRMPDQIVEINRTYQEIFKVNLVDNIEKHTSGNLERVLVAFATPRAEYLSRQLHKALSPVIGFDHKAVIDCLVSATNADILAVKRLNDSLESKATSKASGNFRLAVMNLFAAQRQETPNIDLAQAEADALTLYTAYEGANHHNIMALLDIVTKRSNAHLQQVDRFYQQKFNKTLVKAMIKEATGDFEDILVALVKPFDQYWAERIHDAIAGLGTDDNLLARCFGLLNKAQLQLVAAAYQRKYNESLPEAVKGDTSGWYEKALLAKLK